MVHISCAHQTSRAGVNQLTGVPCASELTCLSIYEIVVRIGLNSYSQTIFCTFCELRPVANELRDQKRWRVSGRTRMHGTRSQRPLCRYVKATRVVVRCRRGIYERRALPLQDAAADVDDAAAVQVWSPVVPVNPRRRRSGVSLSLLTLTLDTVEQR